MSPCTIQKKFKPCCPLFSIYISQIRNTHKKQDTKILVQDFQKRVAKYLNTDKSPQRIRKQQSEPRTITIEDLNNCKMSERALNNSLCTNRYNYGVEVIVIDNEGAQAKQMITYARIQERLLKAMENILKDKKVDYDEKMRIMTKYYEGIVRRQRKTFKMRVPRHYKLGMSDYNDFYMIGEKAKVNYHEAQMNDIADQLISSVSVSSKKTITEPIQSDIFEQFNMSEVIEDQTQRDDHDSIQIQIDQIQEIQHTASLELNEVTKPDEILEHLTNDIETQVQRPKRPVKNKSKKSPKVPILNLQTQSSQQSDTHDSELRQAIREIAAYKEQTQKNSQLDITIQQDIMKQSQQIEREIQRIKNESHEYIYQQEGQQDNFQPIQRTNSIQLENEQQDQELTPIKTYRETNTNIQKPSMFRLSKKEISDIADQQIEQLIQQNEIRPKQPSLLPSPRLEEQAMKQSNNSGIRLQEMNRSRIVRQDSELSHIEIAINHKLDQIETNLDKVSKNSIIDDLLASDSVFAIDLKHHKIGRYDQERAQDKVPMALDNEDREVFLKFYAWQQEIIQVIPKLNKMKRDANPTSNNIGTMNTFKTDSSDSEWDF